MRKTPSGPRPATEVGPPTESLRGLAGFDFAQYNHTFLSRPGEAALNDAAGYGVRVVAADVTPGQEYWRVVGVHHLTPAENTGKRNVFVDLLDADGRRIHDPALQLCWSWEGQQPGQASPPKAFDKPDAEPATNLDLYSGQHVRVFVGGDSLPSDAVENMHTGHPDEPGPHGETWNSVGHHSFYVAFQRTRKAAPGVIGGDGHAGGATGPTGPQPPVAAAIRVRDKLGIDANRPIDPKTGAIAPQVADPGVIAGTGAGWVRLNFVLGEPWSGPLDENRPQGLTWAETYRRIIDGFRAQGLNIYGLIGAEAMREDPGDRFRDPIAGPLSNEWIGRYAQTFAQIAGLFKDDVECFESFNEPDDWHGRRCNWVHPEWFALMLQEVYNQVRSDPALGQVKLISGPLQGLDVNGNAGADYLRLTYQAGKRFFGWGQPGAPFPFDGVGYHLYIAQNPANVQADIAAKYRTYMEQVRRVIREEEGADKPIYLSEFGWQSSVTGDARQAECMRVGSECVLKDPSVALGFWFCTQDFEEKFGLYRQGDLSATNRKPVYEAFKAFCAAEVEAPTIAAEAQLTYPPPAGQEIEAPPDADPTERVVANTWNRYGGLLLAEAGRLGIDPGVAVAVLVTEASGEPFGADGRLIIRFENHLFYAYWGKQNEERFRQHFAFNPDQKWKEHRWRPDANAAWQSFHGNQDAEWRVFEFARGLDERAAMLSLAMGAPQIMGFNHATIGYARVQEMFDAFCADVRHQLTSLFRFMEVNSLVDAVRQGDYLTFARVYNGPGQAEIYKGRIEEALAAYQRLRGVAPTAGVAPMPAAAPVPAAAPAPAVAPGPQPRAPMPPSPTPEPLSKADPALYAAWSKHIQQGLENNQVMFSRLLEAFMHPYWTTIRMYRVLFAVGIAAFLVAAGLSAFAGKEGYALIFGGIGAVAMLSYFFNRPLQALEENLQFITWLGVIYNTYWTRLVYAQNLATFQQDIDQATDDTIAQIKELMDKHAERSGRRPGLR